MTDLTGHMVGQYRIENRLGEGGAAVIYRAYQPSMERYVAIKVLKASLTQDPHFLARFRREGRTVAQLQHPHILPVIDFGQTGDFAYLVMVLLEGGSLSNYLFSHRPLALQECRRLFTQIASALEHAHSRGVIHRDLKPANVLLDESINAYLTDFGIARIMEQTEQFTKTGVLMGTPHYLSPEQAMGRPVDARSDIYALGVMLYEMAVGRVPFDADTPYGMIFQHIQEPPPLPSSFNPHIPPAVEQVILKALEKDPRKRYQTPMAMAEALAQAVPPAPAISKQEEEAAEREPLGGQSAAGSTLVSTLMAEDRAPTPPPTLVPTRPSDKDRINITSFAGDPRDGIPLINGFMNNAVRAIEEIAGRQATEIILRFADLENVLDNLPPNNLKLSDTYTFKHYSALNHSIVRYYGASGQEAVLHLGRVASRWLMQGQPLLGFSSVALRLMPTAAAWRLGLNQTNDTFKRLYREAGHELQVQFLEKPDFFLFALKDCPCCSGKKANAPICWMWTGLLLEGGHIVKGKTFPIKQIACQAMGHPYCVWRIGKRPVE
ncbi:MAG: protein kinase [Anaerolineae bacterium]|nr:protein kinase [Anaerolineae bacterium]